MTATRSKRREPLTPFARWDDVPLVCRIEDTARVLNRSRRSIERDLERGTMNPQPMPRTTKREPLRWSRAVLQEFVEGGYLRFASRPSARARHFGKPHGRGRS
ncbi:MAG: hypothetical protein AB7O67_01915 [Vicinamibacterales bacterium]